MANKNRDRGNNYELTVIKKIKHLYPEAVSSRSESKRLDNKQVDIVFTGGFHIQCKLMSTKPDYKILDEMPQDKIPVIFHKYTRKGKTNFVSQGEYAILKLDDFIKIMELLNK